ncbi:MAG: LytR C-terminal domain-containing protein [Actinobacteria bacterium]|nr:LytR C-terminal domain-containing protein [Actinomycetota bacterium]
MSGHSRAAAGTGYRARRSAALRRRRQKTVKRTLLVFSALVIVGGLAFAVVQLLGRTPGGASHPGSAPTSVTQAAGEGPAVLLAVMQDATTVALLCIDPVGPPTILVALPGDTLVKTGSGFNTVSELAATRGAAALRESIGSLLGVDAGTVAELQWAGLRNAAVAVGQGGSLPPALVATGSATSVLTAAGAVAAAAKTAKGQAALGDLELNGTGAETAREALRELPSPPEVQAVVPGKDATRGGVSYFEPDLERIASLLGRARDSRESVEVQNGSGEIGVAEAATEVISILGLTMLEPKNAEQFPDVASTQILAAPDAVAQAERVRTLLKVGKVVEQKDLPAGRIVVIIGKDLAAASLPSRGE